MINLCNHAKDHGVPAEWHFFATSHGKSPCDGIGGTVKRLVARASLQATTDKQILTPQELFSWCVKNIQGISFLYVSTEDIQSNEEKFGLENRYALVKTIPGTRSHHAFIPTLEDCLDMKRISADSTHSLIRLHSGSHELRDTTIVTDNAAYQPGQYVACTYDNVWHIGHIIERSDANNDVKINFMRRTDKRLSWPTRPDKCWVPFQHILCSIAAPEVEGTSARQYKLSQHDYDRIILIYEQIE